MKEQGSSCVAKHIVDTQCKDSALHTHSAAHIVHMYTFTDSCSCPISLHNPPMKGAAMF